MYLPGSFIDPDASKTYVLLSCVASKQYPGRRYGGLPNHPLVSLVPHRSIHR